MNPQADAQGRLLEEHRAYLRLLGRLQVDDRLQSKVESGVIQETLLEASRAMDQFQQLGKGEQTAWLRTRFVHKLQDAVEQFRTAKRDAARDLHMLGNLDPATVLPKVQN
jgi:DNA-directed RNA polymerase specialized sigma24 family protein